MKFLLHFTLCAAIFFVSFNTKAQVNSNYIKYIFSQDSLNGFDENTAHQIALSKRLSGKEYQYYLYTSKREFVNHKYQLATHNHATTIWNTVQTATIQPACTNIDFETGSLFGWNVSSGGNTNSLTMGGCCPTTGGLVNVVNSIGNDPLVPALSLVSPFGGNKIVKLNDASANNKSQRISQTFNVTSSNAIFQIAYTGVLNSGNHDCFEQPYINISIMDSTGAVLPCPKINIQAPDPMCAAPASVTAGWTPQFPGSTVLYHTWEVKTIDLSPYIGSYVTVQITVGDCIYTAHYGYAYFDFKCNPLEIILDNGTTTTIFDATPQVPINISTCGAMSATVTAPDGLGPYLWNGPAGSGVTGVTTQSMATSTSATYTLVMNPAGNCYGPITKYIILNSSPNPTVTNITAQATCTNATGSGTINVASGTSPFIYNWLPAITTGSIATGLSTGIDYTVTVVDTFGCRNSTIISIASFTDAPTYTVTPLNGVLTCNTTSLTISVNTATNTTSAWTHTNTTNFNASSSGIYDCVFTNTISSCTATVPVTVSSNTTAPTATIVPLTCNINTVTLNANSTAGVALGWTAPTLPPTFLSNPGTSTSLGIFTLTATNLSTGCKNTYTVESALPSLTVALIPNTNVLTCITKSIQSTGTFSPSTANFTWSNGVTTSTVNPYTISAPGTYTANVTNSIGCSSQSLITITSNTVASVNITSTSTIIPCSTNSLALSANTVGTGVYTYTWQPSTPTATGSVYNVSNSGTYSVSVLNTANGCTATATQSVSHESVNASFIVDSLSGYMPLAVSFTNTSVNIAGTTYVWDLGNATGIYTINNPSTVYNPQGTYTVVLTATNGFCQDTAVQLIHVKLVSFLTVPNVFTPNGDGKNDLFTFGAINIGEISLTIFDRWGLKITDITSTGNVVWDGKNKGGSNVTDGTYFYIIKAAGLDDKKYDLKGTVNVFH